MRRKRKIIVEQMEPLMRFGPYRLVRNLLAEVDS